MVDEKIDQLDENEDLLTEELIEVGSEAWYKFMDEILDRFAIGETIPHEYLKLSFGFRRIKYSDYDEQEDFLSAVEKQQFSYMTLTKRLQEAMLEEEKYLLVNVKGEGYRILPPSEQVYYGYNLTIREIKNTLRKGWMIMTHVNTGKLTVLQRKHDADVKTKFGMYRSMILGMFDKRSKFTVTNDI